MHLPESEGEHVGSCSIVFRLSYKCNRKATSVNPVSARSRNKWG